MKIKKTAICGCNVTIVTINCAPYLSLIETLNGALACFRNDASINVHNTEIAFYRTLLR